MSGIQRPSLKVKAATSSADAVKALRILQQFVKSMPAVVEELAERAADAAIEIAPAGKDTAQDRYGYYRMGSTGTPLKQMINYQAHGDLGFSLVTESSGEDDEIKAVMQEFGYPYDTKWGPYPPNPKRAKHYRGTPTGKIRGLGYLRIGLIYASSSLNLEKTSYFKTYSPSDVQNYQAVVEKNLKRVLSILSTGFATGKAKSLPNWYKRKVQLPTETVSKFTSKFGSFDVEFNVPINVELANRDIVNSASLRGIRSSRSGTPFAPRRRFLLDL